MKIFSPNNILFSSNGADSRLLFLIKINIRDCFLLYCMSSHFASQMCGEATPKLIAVFDGKKNEKKKRLSI